MLLDVDALLKQLALQEKAGNIQGSNPNGGPPGPPGPPRPPAAENKPVVRRENRATDSSSSALVKKAEKQIAASSEPLLEFPADFESSNESAEDLPPNCL